MSHIDKAKFSVSKDSSSLPHPRISDTAFSNSISRTTTASSSTSVFTEHKENDEVKSPRDSPYHVSIISESKFKRQKCQHIMILYNSKSGGKTASSLIKYFNAYTNLIYDLFKLNSSDAELLKLSNDLRRYENKLIVFIVGGDGSQCWAVSLIEEAIHLEKPHIEEFPVIIPYPVGSGNDLSRALGWSHIEKPPIKIIKHVADAQHCYNHSKRFDFLDRWSVDYAFDGVNDSEPYITVFDPPLPKTFLCYLSFGYDAKITYEFHQARERNPEKFTSQRRNQRVYVKLGAKELVSPSDPINDSVKLKINGKEVEFPNGVRSLKCVNLNSAASGTFFWGNAHSKIYRKPCLNDGLIEVMATKGPRHLATIKSGFSHAHRLGQSNNIRIEVVKVPIYLQIDGEGWKIDKKCTLSICLKDQLPTLIGYKQPRGVYHKFEPKYFTTELKKERHKFRDVIRVMYGIPRKFPKNYSPKKKARRESQSVDISKLSINGIEEPIGLCVRYTQEDTTVMYYNSD